MCVKPEQEPRLRRKLCPDCSSGTGTCGCGVPFIAFTELGAAYLTSPALADATDCTRCHRDACAGDC
jgi:hypothetical protein